MARGFIQYIRSAETRELLSDPNAFALLGLIAYRAKRTAEFSIYGLEIGEALIGDYKSSGMTRGQYRGALKRLNKFGFITTRTTNKGTIAKLINSSVFDVNLDYTNHQTNHQTTKEKPPANHLMTTNNKEKNLKECNKTTVKFGLIKDRPNPELIADKQFEVPKDEIEKVKFKIKTTGAT